MTEKEIIDIIIAFMPLIILQLSLQIYSVYHVYRKSNCKNKHLYVLLIIFGNYFGVAIYWLIGDKGTISNNSIEEISDEGDF